jgi:hypothetical protein
MVIEQKDIDGIRFRSAKMCADDKTIFSLKIINSEWISNMIAAVFPNCPEKP